MTLRDYFAAAALTGVYATESWPDGKAMTIPEVARHVYKMADAMLKAREAK